MPKFEFDVIDIKNELKLMSSELDNYKDDCNTLFINLKKVDSAWYDDNSKMFYKNIVNDHNDFLTHANVIKKYIEVINSFISNLENVIYNNLTHQKVRKVKINTTNINSILDSLNNVYNYIDNCISIIEYMAIPDSFVYKKDINNMQSDLYSIKNYCQSLSFDLQRISNYINNIYNETAVRIARVEFKNINDKKMEYHWSKCGFNGKMVSFNTNGRKIAKKRIFKASYKFSNITKKNLYNFNKNSFVANFSLNDVKNQKLNNLVSSSLQKSDYNNDIYLQNNQKVYNNFDTMAKGNKSISLDSSLESYGQSSNANYSLNDIKVADNINNLNYTNSNLEENIESVNLKFNTKNEANSVKPNINVTDISLNLKNEYEQNDKSIMPEFNISSVNMSSSTNKVKPNDIKSFFDN